MQLTIRELARLAGLSKSTVAAALKGDADCSAETRVRVCGLAAKLGYKPNPLVVANMAYVRATRRVRMPVTTIGYLSSVARKEVLRSNSEAQTAFAGASERAAALGFRLDLLDYVGPGMTLPRMRKVIEARGIEGLVVAPHTQPQIALDMYWEQLAVVCIGFSIVEPRFDRVGFDHYEAQREACFRAWERGYRRIGLVMSHDFDERVIHLTKAGFQRWQDESGAEALPVLVLHGDAHRPLEDWKARHRPDCTIAHGFIPERLFRRSALRPMPKTGHAAPVYSKGYFPLCGYEVAVEKLAATAVDILAGKLYRNERGLPRIRQTVLVLG